MSTSQLMQLWICLNLLNICLSYHLLWSFCSVSHFVTFVWVRSPIFSIVVPPSRTDLMQNTFKDWNLIIAPRYLHQDRNQKKAMHSIFCSNKWHYFGTASEMHVQWNKFIMCHSCCCAIDDLNISNPSWSTDPDRVSFWNTINTCK